VKRRRSQHMLESCLTGSPTGRLASKPCEFSITAVYWTEARSQGRCCEARRTTRLGGSSPARPTIDGGRIGRIRLTHFKHGRNRRDSSTAPAQHLAVMSVFPVPSCRNQARPVTGAGRPCERNCRWTGSRSGVGNLRNPADSFCMALRTSPASVVGRQRHAIGRPGQRRGKHPRRFQKSLPPRKLQTLAPRADPGTPGTMVALALKHA